MSESNKRRAEVLRPFKDAGTGESFKKGDTPLIEAGAFANYEAAGLVQAASTAAAAPKDPPKDPPKKD